MHGAGVDECRGLRVWAELDRAALRANLRNVRSRIGSKTGIMAVVKANAYGHGVREVVPTIRDGVSIFAVATVDEASVVRTVEPERDILLLSPCLPEERLAATQAGLIVTVSNRAEAEAYSRLAGPRKARLHFKIDTGMGRIGEWHETALDSLAAVTVLPGIELHSVSTHLPSPDEDELFTRDQLALFDAMAPHIRKLAPRAKIHALNSAGLCDYAGSAHDVVRTGLMLYGSAPVARHQPVLVPVLTFRSRVLLVRDVPAGRSISYGRTFITPHAMKVATLAVGYADGYPRQASGRGACVLIGGRRCPVLGRITMDQIVVDVSGVPETTVGDVATLIGADGAETIFAAEVAAWADTIAWHVFTGIGGRTRFLWR